jgi:alpha-D-ribose 1-methylphosphonate 5-triphosphate synthase subunit PhnG
MGLLARAGAARLADLMPDLPAHRLLRGPETGTVMLRGRAGATGAPFNLGEMTVTRCTLRLEDGAVGHAHVQGRSHDHARRAAVADALLQGPSAAAVAAAVLAPLAEAEAAARAARAAKAAATRVEFFTLVRGEDP